MILTTEGKIFVNGLSTSWKGYKKNLPNQTDTWVNLFTLFDEPEWDKNMAGKIDKTALYEFKEVNIAKDFPELEQGDKIVDFCLSHGRSKLNKTLFAIVTQSGKLYIRSDELKTGSMGWKLKTADRDPSNKGDKMSFRIKQLIKDNKNY